MDDLTPNTPEQALINAISPHFDRAFYLHANTDVALAGIDPVLHYVRWGHREGREPHPRFSSAAYSAAYPEVAAAGENLFDHHVRTNKTAAFPPEAEGEGERRGEGEGGEGGEGGGEGNGDVDERLEILAFLAPLFDPAFYLAENPDVAAAGVDALAHFVDDGHAEGRDPSPDFSLAAYLAANPDVAESGMNPLLHFARHGLREGRELRPKPGASDAEHRLIAPFFNRIYYLSVNPDVAAAGLDPLDHFMTVGWQEGRDPNPYFSTRFYLQANADIAAGRRNPFVHFIEVGRWEDRECLPPPEQRIDILKQLGPLDFGPGDGGEDPDRLDAEALAELLSDTAERGRLIVSVAHDDHDRSTGGIQLCVDREATLAAERTMPYLAVFPDRMRSVLAGEGTDPVLGLRLDGVYAGTVPTSALAGALRPLSASGVRISLVVHSLFGHAPEKIVDLAATADEAVFWLHDYSVLCPGHHLLRNRVTLCGAPPMDSTACRICVFGVERHAHVRRVDALLARVPFRFVAPSEFARDRILADSSGRPIGPVAVVPHCSIVAAPAGGDVMVVRRPGPVRIGYLGWPAPFKGWLAFLRLANEYAWDGRYQFHAFTASEDVPSWIVRHPVTTRGSDPQAMVRALRDADVDVVLLWSTWPDTFSIAVHEAIAAGATVVTTRHSGNIARVVEREAGGYVLSEIEELRALLDGRELAAKLARPRSRRTGSVAYSRMSFELLTVDHSDGDIEWMMPHTGTRHFAAVRE